MIAVATSVQNAVAAENNFSFRTVAYFAIFDSIFSLAARATYEPQTEPA